MPDSIDPLLAQRMTARGELVVVARKKWVGTSGKENLPFRRLGPRKGPTMIGKVWNTDGGNAAQFISPFAVLVRESGPPMIALANVHRSSACAENDGLTGLFPVLAQSKTPP
jgi:hypothetical protein